MTEYRLFMDESGNHGLKTIDPNYPVFCLVACIFEKNFYQNYVREAVDNFKCKYWGRPSVILRSYDIRRQKNDFNFLKDVNVRNEFYEDLNQLISSFQFSIISSVILKYPHKEKYGDKAFNPYHMSLEFIMERFCLSGRSEGDSTGYLSCESRGKPEDELLKVEFFRLRNEGNKYLKNMKSLTNIWMFPKKDNIVGLQIADLVAYPIAMKVLHPDVSNKSTEIVFSKIRKNPRNGSICGYGLKVFPD